MTFLKVCGGIIAAVLAGVMTLAVLMPGRAATANPAAHPEIPPAYLIAYNRAADTCTGLDANLLAAVGFIESRHGQVMGPSSAGAVGPMQFLPTTYAEVATKYDVDGDDDGTEDVWNPADAVPAAAHYLCDGAGGDLTGEQAQRRGLWAYNHSTVYADNVLNKAAEYRAYVAPERADPTGPTKGGAWGNYQNGRIPLPALCPIPWEAELLRCDAARALTALDVAYQAAFGTHITISDSYRDYDQQVITKRTKGNLAAEPGTSNHGWGIAVDLGAGANNFGTPQHNFLKENAENYGWHQPPWARANGSKPEAWHWEYKG